MYIKFLKYIDHIVDTISVSFAWAASVAIILATILICVDVLLRNLFSFPINGVSEIVGFGIVSVVFLQIGITIRRNRLISAEIFSTLFQKISPSFSNLLTSLFFVAALVVFILYPSTSGQTFIRLTLARNLLVQLEHLLYQHGRSNW